MKIFCIAGTRPEFIKIFPVYNILKQKSAQNPKLEISWIKTSQHTDLTEDLENFFELQIKHIFHLEECSNAEIRLAELHSQVLKEASKLFLKEKPDLVVVQGDTISAQACALAAFYQKIKIAHIEAGLRTRDIQNPFPEELARRIISQIADLNFSPELKALENLENEKDYFQKTSLNFHTGNTVIDCLYYSIDKITSKNFNWTNYNFLNLAYSDKKFDLDDYIKNLEHKKYILITAHRRENLCKIDNLTNAIKNLSQNKLIQDFEFIIIVHKNPKVKSSFAELYEYSQKEKFKSIHLLEAPNYPSFLKLMSNCYFIVTDSGGIQEEAPYLKKPVLVFRETTERIAGLELGLTRLIGTKEVVVHGEMLNLMSSEKQYQKMIEADLKPYGDGLAASRIVDIILKDGSSQITKS